MVYYNIFTKYYKILIEILYTFLIPTSIPLMLQLYL